MSESFQRQLGLEQFEMCHQFQQVWTQILLCAKMFPSWHKSQPSLQNSQDSISTCSPFDFHSEKFWFKFVLFVCSPVLASWDHIWQMKHANDKKGKYCAMDILPFWIFGQNSSLIRFKHENMCQPHHGGRPPLCCFYVGLSKMYLSKFQNVFVWIAKCICLNC